MNSESKSEQNDWSGESLHMLMRRLYPICRSITGNGVRSTLDILSEYIPIQQFEVPSGTKVFDWEVPQEWNVQDAWIKNAEGEKVVDFSAHSLHLMSYSEPVHTKLSLGELKEHLHTLPDQPELIPYRTSYYKKNWGFCLAHNDLASFEEGEYEILIDSSFRQGSLTYGECVIPGETEQEILIFSHICHPSLCNDNLSGLVISSALAHWLKSQNLRYTYRFVFAPGTIGSITWLAQNQQRLNQIMFSLVAVLLGGHGCFTYKRSRFGSEYIDQVVELGLRDFCNDFSVLDFSPYGYDERQFNSPGIKIPTGRLTRTPNACFPEYHTSADNLAFVTPESLEESLNLLKAIVTILQFDKKYMNTCSMCEPQLGKRGLYRTTGGKDVEDREMAMLWLLNQSDGDNSLLHIAKLSGLPFSLFTKAAQELESAALLRKI